MKNKSFPRYGISKWPSFSFAYRPENREAISKELNRYFQSRSVRPPDFKDFYTHLELAINYSLFMKGLPDPHSKKEVRIAIEEISLETYARKRESIPRIGVERQAIDHIEKATPPQIRSWLHTDEVALFKAKTLSEIAKSLRKLKIKARKELSSPGPNHNQIPEILAKDIRSALIELGIKELTISKPTYSDSTSSIYCLVVNECLKCIGFNISDPSYYLYLISS